MWSPDDGLSLALLIENVAFAPFVFLAAVLVDLSIAGLHRSLGVTMAAELSLTLTYVGLAFVLKNTLKFDIRQFRLPDVVAFLILVPVGAAFSAFIYCGVLYLGGGLSSDKVFVAHDPLLDRRRARDRHDHTRDNSRFHVRVVAVALVQLIRCSRFSSSYWE